MATGLPYDGFYNGDVTKMMANGTYADFRHIFVKKVELGKMKESELATLDKEWEAIPMNEKKRLRAVVVDESTPKPVTIKTSEGQVTMMLATPSEDNNLKKISDKIKVPRQTKRPLGALSEENSPLVTPTAK